MLDFSSNNFWTVLDTVKIKIMAESLAQGGHSQEKSLQ